MHITHRLASPVPKNRVDVVGQIDTQSPALKMFFAVTTQDGMYVLSMPSRDSTALPAAWAYSDGFMTIPSPLPAHFIQMNSGFSILGDDRRMPVHPSPLLFWGDHQPRFAPVDSLGR